MKCYYTQHARLKPAAPSWKAAHTSGRYAGTVVAIARGDADLLLVLFCGFGLVAALTVASNTIRSLILLNLAKAARCSLMCLLIAFTASPAAKMAMGSQKLGRAALAAARTSQQNKGPPGQGTPCRNRSRPGRQHRSAFAILATGEPPYVAKMGTGVPLFKFLHSARPTSSAAFLTRRGPSLGSKGPIPKTTMTLESLVRHRPHRADKTHTE